MNQDVRMGRKKGIRSQWHIGRLIIPESMLDVTNAGMCQGHS